MSTSDSTLVTDPTFTSESGSSDIVFIVVNGLIIVVGTMGNLLVLTVVFANIRLATVSNLLIVNLASVDLLTTAVVIPGDIYRHVCARMGHCHVSETFVIAHRTFAHFIVTAAATSLFVIAIDRFISIAYPMKYTSLFTKSRAVACVVVTWILGVVVTAVFNGLKVVYIQNVFCICLLLLMFALYAYILSVALKHERRIAAMQVRYERKASIFPWERKSAQTMAIILGVYGVCWIPSVVYYSIVAGKNREYPNVQLWMKTVYYLNAALNPFIYGVRSKRFRQAVRKLISN